MSSNKLAKAIRSAAGNRHESWPRGGRGRPRFPATGWVLPPEV